MTMLILRGDDVKKFLELHDQTEVETWTCPICGNVNRGLYYSHEAPCPKCGEFRHPPMDARIGYPHVRSTTDKLEHLRSDRSDLEGQIEGLREQIWDLEEEISEYDHEIANTEAILSTLQEQRSSDLKEAVK